MVSISREAADSPDARVLIAELDSALALNYAPESRHGYSVGKLLREGVHFYIARVDGLPAGCGGLRFFDAGYAELKRMYVRPQHRGAGLGAGLLAHLEGCAQAAGIMLVRLETGIYQTAAIRLYERAGYVRIPPFGPYRDDPVSLCCEKRLG